jgi:GNAT superfamily N-acetyltransferase
MIGGGGNDKPKCTLDIFMDKTKTSFTIRPAQPQDAQSIYNLIVELALFEKEPDAVKTTPKIIYQQLSSLHNPPFQCVVAEVQDDVVGFALYFFNYSTWRGQKGIYLEDLFVQENHRKQGIAYSLFQFLAQVAQDKDCGRIDWSVLTWNQLAIDFYERLGATQMSSWIGYRLEGQEVFDLLTVKNHLKP